MTVLFRFSTTIWGMILNFDFCLKRSGMISNFILFPITCKIQNTIIVLFLFRDPACNSQPVPGLLGPALLRGVAVLLQQPAGHPPHAGVRGLH